MAEALGKPAHQSTVSRTLARPGCRERKVHARPRAGPARREGGTRRLVRARFAGVRVDRLVFVDEFGAATNMQTSMQRTHDRAPPGQRVLSKVPHGHWKTISTIAALTAEGIVASASFDAATDTELIVAFVAEARGRWECVGRRSATDGFASSGVRAAPG